MNAQRYSMYHAFWRMRLGDEGGTIVVSVSEREGELF